MIKTKVAFLKGRLFSSQSELFENFSNCSDWLDKSRPSKKATFLITLCKQAISVFPKGTATHYRIESRTKILQPFDYYPGALPTSCATAILLILLFQYTVRF